MASPHPRRESLGAIREFARRRRADAPFIEAESSLDVAKRLEWPSLGKTTAKGLLTCCLGSAANPTSLVNDLSHCRGCGDSTAITLNYNLSLRDHRRLEWLKIKRYLALGYLPWKRNSGKNFGPRQRHRHSDQSPNLQPLPCRPSVFGFRKR